MSMIEPAAAAETEPAVEAAPEPVEDSRMPGFTETGKLRLLIMALGVGISLLHIYFNIITLLPTLWQNALHYAGFALLCVLIYRLEQSAG